MALFAASKVIFLSYTQMPILSKAKRFGKKKTILINSDNINSCIINGDGDFCR